MHVIGYNASCKCGSSVGLLSLLSVIEESFSTWDVVYLCEADRVASSSFCVEHPRHRVIRYWPGDGSFAFVFVVHQRLASVPLHVFGQNRACLLELKSSDHGSSTSLSVVGVHGPHSHYREFLSDLSQVLSERKCSGPCACVGDWNVNLANSRFCDFPCVLDSDRNRLREDEEYSDFVGFVTESLFEVSCAREIASTPDSSAWRSACTNSPYTRVPLGAQLGSPSVLDFGVGSRGVFRDVQGSWKRSPSDHAIMSYVVACKLTSLRRPVSHFWCRDRASAVAYARTFWPSFSDVSRSDSVHVFLDFLHQIRHEFEVPGTARSRRENRMPLSLQFLYHRLDSCPSHLKADLRAQCWRSRVLWFKNLKAEALKRKVDSGKSVSKSKKLFRLKALSVDGQTIRDDQPIAEHLARHFEDKFGSSLPQLRASALDFSRSSEGLFVPFPELDIEICLEKLKRQHKLDDQSVCVDLLRIAFEGNPDLFASVISSIASSEISMRALSAPMRCFGKKSSVGKLGDIRGIVPPSSLLRLLDILLARALETHLSRIIPHVPGVYVGARRCTQIRDLGHAASLLMEKGLDLDDGASLAQGDIRRYFDSLPVLLILRWLQKRDVPVQLLAAICRHQLFTALYVVRSGVKVHLAPRSKGGLTGSTVALTLARVPVESTFVDLYPSCALRGFSVGPCRLVFGSWVDNILCASHDPADALTNLRAVFKHLSQHWGLELKPGSVSVLSTEVSDDFELEFGIPLLEKAEVFGWWITNTASPAAQWKDMCRKAWGLCLANTRSRSLGSSRRLLLLERVVKPFVMFKLQPFGASDSYVTKLRSLQRRMVARCLGQYKLSTEDWKAYFQRCSRMAKAVIGTRVSDWAHVWTSNTVSWDDHLDRDWDRQRAFLERHPQDRIRLSMLQSAWSLVDTNVCIQTSFSWSSALSKFHGASWFEEIRTFFRMGARTSSRTQSRKRRGFVVPRWHDVVLQCEHRLQLH